MLKLGIQIERQCTRPQPITHLVISRDLAVGIRPLDPVRNRNAPFSDVSCGALLLSQQWIIEWTGVNRVDLHQGQITTVFFIGEGIKDQGLGPDPVLGRGLLAEANPVPLARIGRGPHVDVNPHLLLLLPIVLHDIPVLVTANMIVQGILVKVVCELGMLRVQARHVFFALVGLLTLLQLLRLRLTAGA